MAEIASIFKEAASKNKIFHVYTIFNKKNKNGDAEKIRDMKGKIKKHLYIGETSRSIYERALEHQNDVEQLKT